MGVFASRHTAQATPLSAPEALQWWWALASEEQT